MPTIETTFIASAFLSSSLYEDIGQITTGRDFGETYPPDPSPLKERYKKESQRKAKPLLPIIPPPLAREGDRGGGLSNIKG